MAKPSESKISIILPVLNEERTLPGVLAAVEKTAVSEIIIVDDGSTDESPEIIRMAALRDVRIRVIIHPVNQGLGAARRAGLCAATGNVIAYLDTDLENPSPAMVERIMDPVLDGSADISIAAFENEGRVTELTVKPLLQVCFPALAGIAQPISGQFTARREFLFPGRMESGKTSVGILIDAYLAGARIAEVPIGTLIHSKRDLEIKKAQARAECEALMKRFIATLMSPEHALVLNKGSTLPKS